MTSGLADMQDFHVAGPRSWQKLMDQGWHGRRLTSTLECASLWDVLLFVTWAKLCQSKSGLWRGFLQHLYDKLIFFAGSLVDLFAVNRASLPAESVPLLGTKEGNTRRIPKVNKILILQ